MNRKINDTERENHRLDKALRLLAYYRDTDTGALRRRIDETIARHRRRKQRIRTVRGAAAAVLLLAVAGGTWWFGGRDARQIRTITAIAPEDVTLTLSDGSTIALGGEAGRGRIAEQHDVAVIDEGGRLVFERQAGGLAHAEPVMNMLDVPKGTRFDIVLEDGTRVWLNAGSRLSFPAAFGGGQRSVRLEGEGYFDVAPDASRPFMVETAGQTLTVLGTRFNLCAYPDEQAVYTTLVSGSVALATPDGDASAVLAPGQQARLLPSGGGFEVSAVDTGEALAWRDGTFVFNGNSLEQVFLKLSRWYDFEYSFDDEAAAAMVLMGEVPVYDDMESILKLIELSGQVEIRRRGNGVHVRSVK